MEMIDSMMWVGLFELKFRDFFGVLVISDFPENFREFVGFLSVG